MVDFKIRKDVSSLPDPLDPDAVYFVRTGQGFDMYVADATGSIAHTLNNAKSYEHYLINTKYDLSLTVQLTGPDADLMTGVIGGVTVYRYITAATDANGYPAEDSFHADAARTELLASRG